MAIMQGTTPTHTFKLPFDTSTIKSARVIYSQFDQILFVREGADITILDDGIETTLTQEETFLIDPSKIVEIQVRFVDHNNDAINSQIMRVSAERCLDTEVLE